MLNWLREPAPVTWYAGFVLLVMWVVYRVWLALQVVQGVRYSLGSG